MVGKLQDKAEDPGLATLARDSMHEVLLLARLTELLKLFSDAIVIVEVALEPARRTRLVGLAVTVKS